MFEYLNSAYECTSAYFGHRKTKTYIGHRNFCNGSTTCRQLNSGQKRGALIILALLVLERRGGIISRRWRSVIASRADAIGVSNADAAIKKQRYTMRDFTPALSLHMCTSTSIYKLVGLLWTRPTPVGKSKYVMKTGAARWTRSRSLRFQPTTSSACKCIRPRPPVP